MDSAEHTAFEAAPSRRGVRGLRIAVVGALAVAAFGWLALSTRTVPGTSLKSAPIAHAPSRSVQGVIRMTSVPQAVREPDASPATLAGLKLERTLRTPIPAESERADPALAPVER
jgi:hypothetical protein